MKVQLTKIIMETWMEQESLDSIEPIESISQIDSQGPPKPNGQRKSLCWYFFHPPAIDKANPVYPDQLKCYYCQTLVKYDKRSSGNLNDHAKNNHKSR
jgi:hypothetical protein